MSPLFFDGRIDSVQLGYYQAVCNDDFEFFDYEGDGDLDLIARHREYGITGVYHYLFLFDLPGKRWIFAQRFPSEMQFDYGGNLHLVDLDRDGDLDLFTSWKGIGGMDMVEVCRFRLYPNLGTFTQPLFGDRPAVDTGFERGYSWYTISDQFYDIDHDGDLDYIFSTPVLRIKARLRRRIGSPRRLPSMA